MTVQANHLVIITGMSGSGKSTALKSFEDMGYFCVDNLPAPLMSNFVDFLLQIPDGWAQSSSIFHTANPAGRLWRFALLVDCRDSTAFPLVADGLDRLRSVGTEVTLFFFECFDDVLVQRFRETRRPHPMMLMDESLRSISDALAKERELLAPFRGAATRILDTTAFSPHDLRRVVEALFRHEATLDVCILSFGFKYGVPYDADLTVDVRFLPNPHFVHGLRDRTGLEDDVRDFVFQSADAQVFLAQYFALLQFLLPRYRHEGKRSLTIGIGCTGGRHRSVAIAEELAKRVAEEGSRVTVRHRDLNRQEQAHPASEGPGKPNS